MTVTASLEADRGVDDANVQAQLRRKRMSARKPPLEVASGRVVDAVAHVNIGVVYADFREFDRQPEVDHCIDDVVVGTETGQSERISIRPCIVVCNIMLYIQR